MLTGEAVIDYFTSEVLKLNAEIDYFMAEHEAKPVAPFPVVVLEEEPDDIGDLGIGEEELAILDRAGKQ